MKFMKEKVSKLHIFCMYYSLRKYLIHKGDNLGPNHFIILNYVTLELFKLFKQTIRQSKNVFIEIPDKIYGYMILFPDHYYTKYRGKCHEKLSKMRLHQCE